MMHIAANWHWPQWIIIVFAFLRFSIEAAWNGRQRVYTSGPESGQPERYNGAMAFIRFAFLMFILACGGFFG